MIGVCPWNMVKFVQTHTHTHILFWIIWKKKNWKKNFVRCQLVCASKWKTLAYPIYTYIVYIDIASRHRKKKWKSFIVLFRYLLLLLFFYSSLSFISSFIVSCRRCRRCRSYVCKQMPQQQQQQKNEANEEKKSTKKCAHTKPVVAATGGSRMN